MFGVRSGRKHPLAKGLKLEELDEHEPEGEAGISECLMRLANNVRPDVVNAVRAIARYTNSGEVRSKTVVGILEHVFFTSSLDITFRKAVDWSRLPMRILTASERSLRGGRFLVGL